MLSDEEKKAIDKLKRSANYFVMPIYETKIILELIEKQSKEIEELKDSNNKLYNILQDNKQQTKYSLENNDKKWENKIKAKIEELNKKSFKNDINYTEFYYKKEVLQSLLEEKR